MRKTALSLGHAKPHVKAEPCPTSAITDFQPVLWKSWQQQLNNKHRDSKFRPELDPHEINTDNGVYHFVRRNVQLKQDKYWSPPTLKPENTVSTAVSAGSVTVDPYFTQATGDTSFTASPYWFRLRNRRDFYTHDDFLAVLLAEAYWENLLVKTLEVPKEPLKKRAGWSKWTKLTATKADSAKGTTHKPEDLAKAKKSQVLAVSSSEDQNLVALKRPFRQRFFAVFRALTGDYQGDAFIQDWVQHRVDEYKVGLKLWMNPSLLTKAVGQQVPNTAEALKGLVPAGKLTKNGFLPSSLEYMSFGGTYQSQFPLPYNLFGSLQLHPNIRRQLQDRHHLDLSNFGYVYHTIGSWQPINERRVGAAGTGYAIDKLYGGSPSEVKSQVTYPGLKSALRDASINATIASLFGYSLRRRYYQVKPTAGPNLLVNESGLPVYRRRDTNPFGAIRVKLFQKRTWAQMHPTGDAQASRIWALRPQSKGMELSEDLLSSSNSLESYFINIDRQRPDFAQSIVKT